MPIETMTNTPKSIREPFELALGAQDRATPALAGNPALRHTPMVAGQGTCPHSFIQPHLVQSHSAHDHVSFTWCQTKWVWICSLWAKALLYQVPPLWGHWQTSAKRCFILDCTCWCLLPGAEHLTRWKQRQETIFMLSKRLSVLKLC